MNSSEFRQAALEMAQYISNYKDNISEKRVLPDVKPGFLAPQLPTEPPQKPEKWSQIMKDLDEKIVPGLTHWVHPHFHAYFPAANTYAGILADMVSGAIGANAVSWESCPVITELETMMLDWLGRAFNIPKSFLFSEPGSHGGGIMLTSASESNLLAMLTARSMALKYLKSRSPYPQEDDSELLPRLVAYVSSEAHSSQEKAAMITLVQLRVLDVDENFALRGPTLKKAIYEDIAKGLHPFFVGCTLGSTGTTSFDNIKEIGPIVRELPACWLHCDGAYGGSSFICPELRGPMEGLEYADSFNCNPNKWLLCNFECSSMWVKDRHTIARSLVQDNSQQNDRYDEPIIEYRHWGIPVNRRFRSLKVWMTLRNYGIEGLQKYVRNHCDLAKHFEQLVKTDNRFEVCNKVIVGLVCFRLISSDIINEKLIDGLNKDAKIHLIPTKGHGRLIIRYAVTYERATKEHNEFAWKVIQAKATQILAESAKTKTLPTSSAMAFTRRVSSQQSGQKGRRLSDFASPVEIDDKS